MAHNKIKIPKSQILWVTEYDEKHRPAYIITSDAIRSKYFLYSVSEDYTIEKIATSVKPTFKRRK